MKNSAYPIALCSLLAALGVAVMLAAGLIPVLTYCSPLIAMIFLIPVLDEFGKGRAWMTWAVTAALSLMLCADKEAAFFYLFLGYYPIIKPFFDRLGKVAGRLAKLAFFALAFAVMYGLILFVLGLDIDIEGPGFMAVIYVCLIGVMMLTDVTLGRMAIVYQRRLRKYLHRGA